jgi:hypothetical protein
MGGTMTVGDLVKFNQIKFYVKGAFLDWSFYKFYNAHVLLLYEEGSLIPWSL